MRKTVALLVLNPFTNDSRVLKEALSLKHAGYEPFIVALHESSLAEVDLVQGIPVRRIRLFTRRWPRIIPVQVLKYLEWLWRASLLARKSDYLHCNDLQTLPVGALARLFRRKRVRVVYDAHEFETNDVANEARWRIRTKEFMERALIRHADATLTVSDSIAVEYSRMYPIEKPTLVLNCPPLIPVPQADLFRERLGISTDSIIFLYQGGLAPGRGIESIMDTFGSLPDSQRVVVFMGYGPMTDIIRRAASNSPNIFYHPAVAPDVLPEFTASADVGLCLIQNLCRSYYYCLPNKLFEYLMAGLPVLVSDLYELRRIVEEHAIGWVVPDNQENAILDAIQDIDRKVLASYGQAVLHCREQYHWGEQENRLLQVYEKLSLKASASR